CQHYYDYPWTF
nr:immunoglobulin light chain junction region [Macaca mulatta]MOV61769.1 immunoglobulin light chain junction region [Macaca mulatta]MOV61784.1 immunoglobulin light chain junction region [Macaca mulatta]MOV62128.1 immunoglobulin light chain junction region [Macaca mulatta]MOV62192.1 immunoglobulin light chain junction region [Macaca mulatta]